MCFRGFLRFEPHSSDAELCRGSSIAQDARYNPLFPPLFIEIQQRISYGDTVV